MLPVEGLYPRALPPWVMTSANQPVGEDIWIMPPSFASLSAGHATLRHAEKDNLEAS